MRTLCVLPNGSPLPLDHGASMRYWNLLGALRMLGDLDVALLGDEHADRIQELSRALGGQRVAVTPIANRQWSIRARTAWLARSDLPVELYKRDFTHAHVAFKEFAAEGYDVVLFADPLCYAALRADVHASALLDLDDVPSAIARRARSLTSREDRRRSRPDHIARAALQRIDANRWSRFEREVNRSGCWILVCSEQDRARLAGDRTEIVPNGYERAGPPLGRLEVGRPPNILFAGRMTYPPNADAATYLVEAVLPRVRDAIGDVRCTIAGRVDPAHKRRWESAPGVVATGFIPRMDDVLVEADLVAAPLRMGGGTRVKLLEAFAHRIPVVSTTIGAEGLGVSSGREVLLADSAPPFADACVELLSNLGLRQRLVDAALDRYEREFRWDDIRERLAGIARRAAESE